MQQTEEGPEWKKYEVGAEIWEEFQQVGWGESQIELLEAAQVEVIGSERVGGIDCYVLQLTPDLEQLWQLSNHLHFDEARDVTEEYLQEVFRSFSVKQWVAKDTYFLIKAEIDIAEEFPPEEEGPSTVDIAVVLLCYNYNQPVTIELPPEAEEQVVTQQQEAAEIELANVQTAVHAMMVDNEIATLPNPVTVGTNDMSAFPDATSACETDKVNDPSGTAYTLGSDLDGFLLYQHDITADAAGTGLVNYLATRYTTGRYTVDSMGTVTQITTGFE